MEWDRGWGSRWWLVVVAAAALGMAGTYQFAWSSIRVSLRTRLGAPETALGTVFTVFIVLQTVSQFPAGWVRDRWGPRIPTFIGALLVTIGYVGTALAPSMTFVYFFYALGGIGVGSVYTVAINTPVKWFSDRRGLATGVVGFAYAGVSFGLIPVLRGRLTADFIGTMLGLATLAGLVILSAVVFLRDPTLEEETDPASGASSATGPGYTWRGVIRTWQFWLLYAVFIIVNGVGLMVIEKVVAFASAMELSAEAATGAASLIALGDGAGVVAGGGASDRFGRERTIAVALIVCGLSLGGAVWAAHVDVAIVFVGLMAASAFFRSPVFAVFPSLVGDYYGTAHTSANYAVLYSAKLWGGVVGGTVTSLLILQVGWRSTFLLGAGLLVVAGGAMVFLRPVRTTKNSETNTT